MEAPKSAAPIEEHFLVLPCEDEIEWKKIESVLRRPFNKLSDLDDIINAFTVTDQKSKFFSKIPGSADAGCFDFAAFERYGAPLMISIALEMPALFKDRKIPLLLTHATDAKQSDASATATEPVTDGDAQASLTPPRLYAQSVTLSHRQVACLLAHSAFGSITASARHVRKEKWAFRAAQLFFQEALPSALCFLNYFKLLGQRGFPGHATTPDSPPPCLRYQRRSFPRGKAPFKWEDSDRALCTVEVADGAIEASKAEAHVDFANRFIGGGCLECDFMMEEILFAIKPELIVAMALCSFMQDEEAILISGARQYSKYSGYASSFEFQGDFESDDEYKASITQPLPMVLGMDALQGMAKIQFQEGLLRRDLNKARVAFSCFSHVDFGDADENMDKNLHAILLDENDKKLYESVQIKKPTTLATGNWGCGAFGNDHVLKFLQQWMAASEAGAIKMYYHTFNDKRAGEIPRLAMAFCHLTVSELWAIVLSAAAGGAMKFRGSINSRAELELTAKREKKNAEKKSGK